MRIIEQITLIFNDGTEFCLSKKQYEELKTEINKSMFTIKGATMTVSTMNTDIPSNANTPIKKESTLTDPGSSIENIRKKEWM